MNEFKWAKGLIRFSLTISVGLLIICGSSATVFADIQAKPVKVLDGEQLYAINCSRCHSERYPTERTDAQWRTLMMHMQVRANLPPEQARKILKYMKENN